MAIKTEPFLGLTYNESFGAQDWNIWTDENIIKISLFANLAVNTIAQAPVGVFLDGSVPLNGSTLLDGLGAGTSGVRVLVGDGATGPFTGKDGQLAVILDGVYHYYMPTVGATTYRIDTGQWLSFIGGGWKDHDDFGTM